MVIRDSADVPPNLKSFFSDVIITVMKVYFVRHGQTDANAAMSNGQSVQELDAPLNATGIEQAAAVAEQLKDVKFDIVISSPLKRALQTAEAVNKYHGLPIILEDSVRERKAGKWIGLNIWNDLFDFDKNIQPVDGESLHDFFDRTQGYFEKLKTEYPDKTVLIVSHGGVQHALYALANGIPRSGNVRISPMHNCEVREYEL
ncbi:MAG: histidine phosphatase family protein [Candidatus Saccharibacteria bacterium]